MPRSTIDAVGSNARCGSAVLISKERSTTSVAVGADDAVMAPDAATAATTRATAARAALAAQRVRKRFMTASGGKGGQRPQSLFLHMQKWKRLGPFGRACGRTAAGLQPAGNGPVALDLERHRILCRAPVERVRASRMEAAGGRRVSRIGHLSRQRLGQEAAPVGMGHGYDQRLGV